MNLADLYKAEGKQGLESLAKVAECSPAYLYQCATYRKTPAPKFALKLIAHEPRLSLEDLYAHLQEQPEERAA